MSFGIRLDKLFTTVCVTNVLGIPARNQYSWNQGVFSYDPLSNALLLGIGGNVISFLNSNSLVAGPNINIITLPGNQIEVAAINGTNNLIAFAGGGQTNATLITTYFTNITLNFQ